MNKETVFSIGLGFVLGFSVAAGIFFFPSFFAGQKQNQLPSVLDEGKTKPSPKEPLLSISIPEDYLLADSKEINVIGKTKSNSLIVISTSLKDYVLDTDSTGNFQQEIELVKGAQEIYITTHLPDGEKETVKRTVLLYEEQ